MSATLETGRALDRFRIDGQLGQGAMSVVYRATDMERGETVALKVLRGELLAAAERSVVLARFEREAQIGMRLVHPNIVRVHTHGLFGGSPWLAMDLITGHELKEYMDAEPPLPVEDAATIMLAVLDALGFAHAQGIVHRDVKPANIVLRDDRIPKLTDFGIAQIPASDVTQTGELLGTPAYVSPEQLRGEKADGRSDLFATGVILYYLLARQRPFAGSVAVVMQRILFSDPPAPSLVDPRVPPIYDAVVMRALAKDPVRRFASAADMAEALRTAMAAGPAWMPALVSVSTIDETLLATDDPERVREELGAILAAIVATTLTEKRLAEVARLLDAAVARPGDRARLALLLNEQGIVPVGALILEGMPAPRRDLSQRRSDWMALIRLFAALRSALGALDQRETAERLTARIAMELASSVLLYSNALNRELMADDNPDIMRLSADFMRLDILLVALEELGAAAELRNAQTTMLMFAGQVMRKVNTILRACTDGNDGYARFGVAVILSDIEDLIVMAGRVLETSADSTGAFQAIGQEIVVEFIELARRFASLSIDELRAEVASGPADPAPFAAKLRPLGALYAFATRLPAGDGTHPISGLTSDLHRGVGALTSELAAAARPGDADARVRLTAVYDMAESLGWAAIESVALGALRRLAVLDGAA